jgi:hypothetical protein
MSEEFEKYIKTVLPDWHDNFSECGWKATVNYVNDLQAKIDALMLENAQILYDGLEIGRRENAKELYNKDTDIQTLQEIIQKLKINDTALCEYANDKDKELAILRGFAKVK